MNDHRRDKARYTIRLTVPAGLEAISNGRLFSTSSSAGWSTWTWRENDQMASYLAVAAIGEYNIRRRVTDAGIPVLDAVDVDLGTETDAVLSQREEIIDFLTPSFGRYPFDEIGAIVEDRQTLAFEALETQTRSVYDHRLVGGDFGAYVVVHELAHQWYGDSVSVDEWKHIWLNEGFATYSDGYGVRGRMREPPARSSSSGAPRSPLTIPSGM